MTLALDIVGAWNSWKLPPDHEGRKPGPVVSYKLSPAELEAERVRLGIKPKAEVGK